MVGVHLNILELGGCIGGGVEDDASVTLKQNESASSGALVETTDTSTLRIKSVLYIILQMKITKPHPIAQLNTLS